MTANDLTRTLLLEIPARYPARVWRRNVLAAKIGDRLVRSTQLPGEADITGIIDIGGIGCRLEIEVKVGHDRIRPAQQVFGDMIRRHNGIYLIARDLDRALLELERARAVLAGKVGASRS